MAQWYITPEVLEKRNAAIRAAHQRPEVKEKHRLSMLGHKVSDETRKKLSEAKLGDKNPAKRRDVREKISKSNVGKKVSEKTKQVAKERWLGENNPNWKDGRSQDHKEYQKSKRRIRRVRKLQADGHHTVGDWQRLKAQYNGRCLCCGRQEPEIVLSEDHIVPLSRGGSDNIENIQPLCIDCNRKKNVKIINYIEVFSIV